VLQRHFWIKTATFSGVNPATLPKSAVGDLASHENLATLQDYMQ
jgi:hypothetical protein